MDPPAAKRLHEITVPALALVGEFDIPDFLNITDLLVRAVPQARKVIIPNVGHMSNMEAPEEANRAIHEFFQQL